MLDTFKLSRSFQPYGGVKVVESPMATALPKARPHTDDMRAMVDHFHLLGLIQRKPCAYQVNGTMFVHPVLMAELRKHTSRLSDEIGNRLDNAFRAAAFGRKA